MKKILRVIALVFVVVLLAVLPCSFVFAESNVLSDDGIPDLPSSIKDYEHMIMYRDNDNSTICLVGYNNKKVLAYVENTGQVVFQTAVHTSGGYDGTNNQTTSYKLVNNTWVDWLDGNYDNYFFGKYEILNAPTITDIENKFTILYSDLTILYDPKCTLNASTDADGVTPFFTATPATAMTAGVPRSRVATYRGITPAWTMSQVITPTMRILVGLAASLIGFLGLRKALAFLQEILHKA